ncbi:hypothetical protein VTO73DRAFT_10245 [Trametes versicolor]
MHPSIGRVLAIRYARTVDPPCPPSHQALPGALRIRLHPERAWEAMGFTGVWGNGALGVYDEGGISYRRVPMAETEKEHGGTHDLARARFGRVIRLLIVPQRRLARKRRTLRARGRTRGAKLLGRLVSSGVRDAIEPIVSADCLDCHNAETS